MSYISVNIDIQDLICLLQDSDRVRLFKYLQKEGFISKLCVITETGEVTLPKEISTTEDEFNNALKRLKNNGWKLNELLIG